MGILDSQTVPITCPRCGRKTVKNIGWVRTTSRYTCDCGTPISLQTDQFRRSLGDLDRAVEEFKRTLKQHR